LHAFLITNGLVLVCFSGIAQAQLNTQAAPADPAASKPPLTLQMPALPDPVAATLNPSTSALLVLDFVEPICNSEPKCKGQDAASRDAVHGACPQIGNGRGLWHPSR
jgi:hypothetical protein